MLIKKDILQCQKVQLKHCCVVISITELGCHIYTCSIAYIRGRDHVMKFNKCNDGKGCVYS